MHIQRLEMMKQMMGRVVAGSWQPISILPAGEKFHAPIKVKVTSLDLGSWSDHKTGESGGACGFSACAVGHACFDEEFRKLGWRFSGTQPYFGTDSSWCAVEKFFAIGDTTAENLFISRKYSGFTRSEYGHVPAKVREAQMVHDRISKLLELGSEQKFNKYIRGL